MEQLEWGAGLMPADITPTLAAGRALDAALRAGQAWRLIEPGPCQVQAKSGDVVLVLRVAEDRSMVGYSYWAGGDVPSGTSVYVGGRSGLMPSTEFMQRFRRVTDAR